LTDIGFYHLTRTGPDKALPQLLGRVLALGQRSVVMCPDAQRLAALDELLWRCTSPDWLPHGTPFDGDANLQPIWLTTEDLAPNAARFLFLIDGACSERIGEYERVFDLFDGQDPAASEAARRRWTAAKAAGHTLTYWQQGTQGWEKKA